MRSLTCRASHAECLSHSAIGQPTQSEHAAHYTDLGFSTTLKPYPPAAATPLTMRRTTA
jgi:hypothetical protein